MSAADDTSVLTYKKTEADATEKLCDIFNQSCAARAALRDMLKVDGADVGPLQRVDTEVASEKRDRVDLAAYDEAGKARLLIEVKFWAVLQDNQPADYLKRLPDDGNVSVLLFVAPESRLETLWSEIRRMAQRDFTLNGISETGSLRVAAVAGGNRLLMLTSWRSLLKEMRSRAGGDSSTEEDIRQLNGLCEQEDSAAFRPLRATEFGPEFPRRMLNFRRLVDDATDRLVSEGRAKTEGLGGGPRTTGYGRYVRIGRNSALKYAWLGVDYEQWAKKETPICLQFYDHTDTIDRVLSFPLRTGVEYEEVLDDLVKQLCGEADRIATAAKPA